MNVLGTQRDVNNNNNNKKSKPEVRPKPEMGKTHKVKPNPEVKTHKVKPNPDIGKTHKVKPKKKRPDLDL